MCYTCKNVSTAAINCRVLCAKSGLVGIALRCLHADRGADPPYIGGFTHNFCVSSCFIQFGMIEKWTFIFLNGLKPSSIYCYLLPFKGKLARPWKINGGQDFRIVLKEERQGVPPDIKLDGMYKQLGSSHHNLRQQARQLFFAGLRFFDAMDKMIPNGAPSLVGCKKLVVEGEVTFAKDVAPWWTWTILRPNVGKKYGACLMRRFSKHLPTLFVKTISEA